MSRAQSVVFYPEDLSLLGNVFDQAIDSIPASMRTPSNKTLIARSILVEAAAGERDPIALRRAASTNLTTSTSTSSGFDEPDRGRPRTVLSHKMRAGYLR